MAKNGVTDFTLNYRLKTLYSLYNKLKRKDWNIEKIHDISALRIILPETEDCYKVMGIIHSIWRPLPGRIKDYIAFPKPNGYRAIHTTIFTGYGNVVEIQIKSREMHREAEFGIASHVFYKEGEKGGKFSRLSWVQRLLPFKNPFLKGKSLEEKVAHEDIPSWIKDLVEYQSSEKRENALSGEIRDDFFTQRIFVFTPKGDVIDLPLESTPIDFAYAIHSEVGNSTAGAKVSGKMVSLDTHLKNGDIVEIITNKKNSPKQKWLEYAKTTAAKKHIKSFLQEHHKKTGK